MKKPYAINNHSIRYEFCYIRYGAVMQLIAICLTIFLALWLIGSRLDNSTVRVLVSISALVTAIIVFVNQRGYVAKSGSATISSDAITFKLEDQNIEIDLSSIEKYSIFHYPLTQYNLWTYKTVANKSVVGTVLRVKLRDQQRSIKIHSCWPYCNPASLNQLCRAFEARTIKHNSKQEIKIVRVASFMAHPRAKVVLWILSTLVAQKFLYDCLSGNGIPSSFYGGLISLGVLWGWRAESNKMELQYKKMVNKLSARG